MILHINGEPEERVLQRPSGVIVSLESKHDGDGGQDRRNQEPAESDNFEFTHGDSFK